MDSLKFVNYAFTVAQKDALISFGKYIQRCLNPPYLVYFSVTYRCNARCTTCLRWQNTDTSGELSLDECKSLASELHRWAGPCNISFTGGEPFKKQDFFELLRYVNSLGLCTNVSSNGIVFDTGACERIIESGLDSIVFSLNSIEPELHNRYKGTPGLHQKITAAIAYLNKKKKRPRIGVLCLITNENYRSLDDFAQWAQALGVDSIDFQPILGIHPANPDLSLPTQDSFFNTPLAQIEDLEALDKQIDLLVQRKKAGCPIVLPIKYLLRIKSFFRKSSQLCLHRGCTVGFRNLYIAHKGDVQLCPWLPPIGNIRKRALRDIWFSKEAAQQRSNMLSCSLPCMGGCMREYGFPEKLSHFLFLIKRRI